MWMYVTALHTKIEILYDLSVPTLPLIVHLDGPCLWHATYGIQQQRSSREQTKTITHLLFSRNVIDYKFDLIQQKR